MKSLVILFILAFCNFTFAQSLSFELDKIRQIKLLESTRDDVKRILSSYKSDDAEKDDEPDYSETFSSENIDIEISYTTGDCSDEADDTDEWKVAKGKVKFIEISFTDSVKFEDLQFYVSNFRKEQYYANKENEFVYHNKELGIAFVVNEGEIETIRLLPANKQSSLLCKNEEAEEFKQFYSNESYFTVPKLEDRVWEVKEYGRSGVADITLSANEITVSCSALGSADNKNCSNSPRIIFVSTKSFDPENDNYVVFEYIVSGGRIVGKGKDVMWDLSDAKPGVYKISAGVDDGCGICSEMMTKEIVVK